MRHVFSVCAAVSRAAEPRMAMRNGLSGPIFEEKAYIMTNAPASMARALCISLDSFFFKRTFRSPTGYPASRGNAIAARSVASENIHGKAKKPMAMAPVDVTMTLAKLPPEIIAMICRRLCFEGFSLEVVSLALVCRSLFSAIVTFESLRSAIRPYRAAMLGHTFRSRVSEWALWETRPGELALAYGTCCAPVNIAGTWRLRAHGCVTSLPGELPGPYYVVIVSTAQRYLKALAFNSKLEPVGSPRTVTCKLASLGLTPRYLNGPVALSSWGVVAVGHASPRAATSNRCMVTMWDCTGVRDPVTVRVTTSLVGTVVGLSFYEAVLRVEVDAPPATILYCAQTCRLIRPM